MFRIVAFLALAVLAARAEPIDKSTLARIESIGVRWWKARPKTCFDRWDSKERAALLEEARGIGFLPEGSLENVRDLLWKSLRKNGPRAKGGGKATIDTPYGEAWFYVKGSGRGKGLVLGLHGGGEGAGSADEAAGKWMLPGCMGMYPQGIRLVHDTWNTVHGEKFILTMIEIAKVQFEVDPDRVYSMGFSMGGTGSWFMAGRHPDLLAGASPCAGVLMASPQSQVATKEEVSALQYGFVPNVRNVAMYYYIGLADKNCMPGTYLYVWDILQDLRKADPTGYQKIVFNTYPDLPHAFPPGEPGKGLQWMEKQRRDPFPEKIVWEYAVDPFPRADEQDKTDRWQKRWFYWVRHERPADRMTVEAVRKGNEFDLTLVGTEPDMISLLLCPAMIDAEKEVVVRVDGKEVYRGKPRPDFATILESLDARLDRTLVFDRSVRLAAGG